MHRIELIRTHFVRALVLILIVMLGSGCTSMRPVSLGSGTQDRPISSGDKLKIETHDGRVVKLDVVRVADGRIEGVHEGVDLADVASIERKEVSKWKTGLLVLAFGVLFGMLINAAVNEAITVPAITFPTM
jgi:hypothetical protein